MEKQHLRFPPSYAHKVVVLAAVTISWFCAGCSRSDLVPVSGRIAMGGQGMPNEGMLYFLPDYTDKKAVADGGPKARPGIAKFGMDGKFTVMTQSNAGLLPGTYLVSVECWKSLPEISGPPPVSLVAKKFQSAAESGLKLIVKPDEPCHDLLFDVSAP
jgi:hypothetical protein